MRASEASFILARSRIQWRAHRREVVTRLFIFIIIGMFWLFFHLLKKSNRREREHHTGFGNWSRSVGDDHTAGQDELPTLLDAEPDMPSPPPPAPQPTPICPVCDHPVDTRAVACPRCNAVHHPECWHLNDGCGRCQAPDASGES